MIKQGFYGLNVRLLAYLFLCLWFIILSLPSMFFSVRIAGLIYQKVSFTSWFVFFCLSSVLCCWLVHSILEYYELIIYAFHSPIPSHHSSITLNCDKHGLSVSFISSIAIDKRVILIIIALNFPSRLSSFPQSTMIFLSVRFSYIF